MYEARTSSLIFSAVLDYSSRTVHVSFFDGPEIWLSFDWFKPNAVCTPDFNDPWVVDYGQTLKLGPYEVSNITIWNSYDPTRKP